MWDKLKQAWDVKEVRNGLLFVLAMMIVFRVAANIPLPGIDVIALQRFFEANQVLGLLNLFSGGTLRNFSIVALGVGPYITASIVFQLLGMIFPKIEEIQRDGEAGRQKINQWTRLLTVPLAIIQSFSILALMQQSSFRILTDTSPLHTVAIIATVTAGTLLLMWIGELISEKKVGNGVSLLITAGILADLPTSVSQFIATFDSSQWMTVVAFAVVTVLMILGVVYVTEGQRNVPVQYARQSRPGQGATGGVTSYLPLRINMVGVIPIIFAISLLLFPSMIAQFFLNARSEWVASVARWLVAIQQDKLVYGILYFLFVFGFTYFYTAIVFQPDKMAENLQKQSGFIPGIRPGKPTIEYLETVITRITLGGALFLGLVAIIPLIAEAVTGTRALTLGGTSMLIVVAVVIESLKQIQAQLTMRQYDAY